MLMSDNKEQVLESLVNKLGCSLVEAMDIVKADYEIDKGKDIFPLSDNQKQVSRKMKTVTSSNHNHKKRTIKPNETKLTIIDKIVKAMSEYNPEVINPQREVILTVSNVKYKIVLSCPRK